MKKIIYGILLVTMMASCAKSSKNDSTPEDRKNTPVKADRSECKGETEKSIEGLWISTMQENGITFNGQYYFERGNFNLKMNCLFNEINLSLTAETHSSIYVNDQTIQFLEKNSDTTYYDRNGTKANCTASIEPTTVNYELLGSCLIFKIGTDELVLKRPHSLN